MWRWLAIGGASLALLAGCDSDKETSSKASPGATASSASAPAKVVARTFLAAALAGRGDAACSLMTPGAVADLTKYVQSAGTGKGECADWFTSFQTSMGGEIHLIKLGRVTVDGKVAKAAVLCPGCQRSFKPLVLRRTGSGWRVDFDYRRGY